MPSLQVTISPTGVFIPLNINGGPAMRDLDALLKKHPVFGCPEGLPTPYLTSSFVVDFAEKHGLYQDGKQTDCGEFQALTAFLALHSAPSRQQATRERRETGSKGPRRGVFSAATFQRRAHSRRARAQRQQYISASGCPFCTSCLQNGAGASHA